MNSFLYDDDGDMLYIYLFYCLYYQLCHGCLTEIGMCRFHYYYERRLTLRAKIKAGYRKTFGAVKRFFASLCGVLSMLVHGKLVGER
ncbi:MAG: hypothetical protein ACI8RD_010641 [Bacillariaceae sp.]|jgi:hypothetical protein